MPTVLHSAEPGFAAKLDALLQNRESAGASVGAPVAAIVADVKQRGDAALIDYTLKFDKLSLTPETLTVSEAEIAAAEKSCPRDVVEAIELATQRIRDYHERQRPQDMLYTDASGTQLGWRWSAIDRAGLYVPGGTASYPSSVLMNAIPAQVAGCHEIIMCVPMPGGAVNPAVLVAATRAGVKQIFKIGGAQAIAAMAYGTATIPAADKIVGPGNAYVAEAKRQVFGTVGIDTIAGPSEILVVADDASDPGWIAADLLSQAEHDPLAQSILITDSLAFASKVEAQIEVILSSLARADIARTSWETHGAIIVITSWTEAPALINRIAPEHLELAVENPQTLLPAIHHAGAIFLGRHTPEAVGDYLAGPSHVLPTSRAARFASGLSVLDFMKRTSIIGCSAQSLGAVGQQAAALARSEGLGAHALSLDLRLKP